MKEIKAEINNSLLTLHILKIVVILTDLKQGILIGLNVRNCEKLSLNVFG
jgi:hypothetical protein